MVVLFGVREGIEPSYSDLEALAQSLLSIDEGD